MKTHRRLLPLAAALALALPAAALTPTPQADTLRTLLAGQACPAATAEQLAAQYPALALLPADATEFLTLNSPHELFGMDESTGEKSNIITAMESIAIATTAGNMPRLCAALTRSLGIGQDERPADAAPPQPVHIVITCKPGEEVLLIMLASKLQSRPGISPLTGLPEGCFGGLIGEGYERQVPPPLAVLIQALREACPGSPLHLMTTMKDNALVIVLCEKPADATQAATPADSVLATAAGRALAPGAEGSRPMAALHLSPNSLGTLRRELFRQACDFFAREGKAPAFAEGAPVLEHFCRDMAARPATRPSILQAWKETDAQEAYSLTLRTDALGMRFEPAELHQLTVADQAPTTFYGETTPLTLPGKVTTPALLRALAEWGFAQILVLKVEEPEARPSAEDLPFIEHNFTESPLFDKVPAGLEQMLGSMQSPTALVVDAGRGADDDGPRIELCTGLTDRRQLEQGFAALAADYAATGHSLPGFTVSDGGNCYVQSEVSVPELLANAAMTATHLAFGLSPTLGQELLAKAARPGHLAAGAVFAFRPEPLADRDRSLRDMSRSLESILGTATITEGVFTLRLRITPTQQDKD